MTKTVHTVKDNVAISIVRYGGEVVFRSDFKSLGSASQISRAPLQLINDGMILPIGHGRYAKARPSVLS